MEPYVERKVTKQGWTFVISKIEAQALTSKVYGHFIYYKLHTIKMEGEPEQEDLEVRYITPQTEPVCVQVLQEFISKNTKQDALNYEISPRDVYMGLKAMFDHGYGEIPEPRVDIPLSKIPPSKRQEFIEQYGELI